MCPRRKSLQTASAKSGEQRAVRAPGDQSARLCRDALAEFSAQPDFPRKRERALTLRNDFLRQQVAKGFDKQRFGTSGSLLAACGSESTYSTSGASRNGTRTSSEWRMLMASVSRRSVLSR